MLTLGLVFVSLLLSLQYLRDAALCFLTALGTLITTLGLSPRVELALNSANVVMIPVLFAIAVAGAVRVATCPRRREALDHGLPETGRATAGAIVTIGAGFGALISASHPALNDLGKVAAVGLPANIGARSVVPAVLTGPAQRRAGVR
jgi:uncharacterized protein